MPKVFIKNADNAPATFGEVCVSDCVTITDLLDGVVPPVTLKGDHSWQDKINVVLADLFFKLVGYTKIDQNRFGQFFDVGAVAGPKFPRHVSGTKSVEHSQERGASVRAAPGSLADDAVRRQGFQFAALGASDRGATVEVAAFVGAPLARDGTRRSRNQFAAALASGDVRCGRRRSLSARYRAKSVFV